MVQLFLSLRFRVVAGLVGSSLLFVSPANMNAQDSSADVARIVEAFVAATRDTDAQVRHAAYSELVARPRSDALVAAIREGVKDEDLNVRKVVLSGLVKWEGPTDEVLQLLVTSLEVGATRELAEQHLIGIGSKAVPALLEALKDDNARRHVVVVLGRLMSPRDSSTIVTHLLPLLSDNDKHVRLATVKALGNARSLRTEDNRGNALADSRMLAYANSIIARYDKDQDGSLTQDEWSLMSRDPSEADTDQDGRITASEYAAFVSRAARRTSSDR